MNPIILIRGGGDIASGVALRLFRSGFKVVMIELEQPLTVRRTVSFSEAIYTGLANVEGVDARKLVSPDNIPDSIRNNEIPILVDEKLILLLIIFFNTRYLLMRAWKKNHQKPITLTPYLW